MYCLYVPCAWLICLNSLSLIRAHLTVCKSEGKYFVKDETKEFKDEVKVIRLELILSFLGESL